METLLWHKVFVKLVSTLFSNDSSLPLRLKSVVGLLSDWSTFMHRFLERDIAGRDAVLNGCFLGLSFGWRSTFDKWVIVVL